MIRRREAQMTIAELVLFGVVLPNPEELMDPVLRRVDALLSDEALVDRVLDALKCRYAHSSRRGRPGTPAEVVLRMLALKHLRGWSYDVLEREVSGSFVYRRFCRIDAGKVPDAKTMVRLGQLVDGTVLKDVFDRVVHQAVETNVTQGRSMRIDTTVVEAPIRYPTDSGLCEDAVRVLRRTLRRLVAAGVKLPFHVRDVARSVSRRMREIAQALRLRGDKAHEAIKKPYRKLLRITGRLIRQATRAAAASRKQVARFRGRNRRAVIRQVARLDAMLPRAQQVVRQTRARVLRAITTSKDKIISLFEPDARILRRGKLHKPTEFGVLVKVQEAENGIVTDVGTVPELADAPLLIPAAKRHVEIFGRAPQRAATDRGFFSCDNERALHEIGVKHAVLPKPGYRSPERLLYEKQRWFRRGRAWRAGGEARIARLKHRFGMARSRYSGERGMQRTIYWAAIANNLVAIATRSA
jgi:IS5 family transposase